MLHGSSCLMLLDFTHSWAMCNSRQVQRLGTILHVFVVSGS